MNKKSWLISSGSDTKNKMPSKEQSGLRKLVMKRMPSPHRHVARPSLEFCRRSLNKFEESQAALDYDAILADVRRTNKPWTDDSFTFPEAINWHDAPRDTTFSNWGGVEKIQWERASQRE